MSHTALNKHDSFQLSPQEGSVQLLFANEPFLRYLGASLPIDLTVEFQHFKAKFNKTFGTEDEYRYSTFCENYFKALLLQYYDQGTAEYGVTEFFHYTQSEFARIYLNQPVNLSNRPADKIVTYPSKDIPESCDWREKGAVSEVKNQGNCGSCWAFSATGNIEGQWFLRKAELLSLSEQELVDCDKQDNGCAGGFMTTAFKAVEELGGLETEEDYPYKADTKTCSFDRSKTRFYVRGIVHLPSFLCPSFMIDHGVLLVGYGVGPTIIHSHVPYWIVKNSWGKSWGEAVSCPFYCLLSTQPTSFVKLTFSAHAFQMHENARKVPQAYEY
ncbi:unnamed protein product [Dibothriocephalus latus]|uniref:PI-PLC Y-box domain-containing protein n=1 Tax=Dibothriocephalus latus TaxID=60516 RepID=A0A3P6THS1_DIBLA|nr:unnamed protein product [Dibothriocephalus latus]